MAVYKAVGFDYGGVIGGAGKTGGDFMQEVSELLGISREELRREYFKLNHLVNEGEVTSWREFWTIFLAAVGQPQKLDQIMALSNERTKEHFIMSQPMLDLVGTLRDKGYKVGLLSNNTKENGQKLRGAGLAEHFGVFHISAETGLMKPKPEAFNLFIKELGVQPEELVFIDDAEKSLSTAQECGFTPVLFTAYDQLIKDLQELGIL